MLPKILLFFALFSACSNSFGQTEILVSSKKKLYQIGNQISFYEDETKDLKLSDILLIDDKFQVSEKKVPNWGLSSAHIWIKIQVQDTSEHTDRWYLNLDYSTLRTANLYYQDTSNNWQVIESGNRVPFQKRKVKSRNFIFPLHLPTDETHTFYLNLSNAGPIQAPLFIQKMSSIYYEQTKMEMYYGVLTGIFILIIVGNFFLWINLKDPAYFFYIVYALGSLLTLLYISGHATQYVLSAYPKLSGTAIGVFISLIIIGLPLFSKNFLHVKNKVLVLVLNGIGVIGILFILYVVLIGYHSLMIIAGMILLALTTLLAFIIGIYSLRAGQREARFFVLGFGIYFVGMTVLILRFLDIVPINSFTNHIVELASIFEIFIISLALSDKYGIEIKRAKQNLEQKVHERTLKLSTANEKLREQDEKLHKNIETLESVQGQMEFKQQELQETNQVLKLKNTQIDRSILAAEHIQKAMLPYKGKIKELLKHYFIIYRPKDIVSGDFYWVNQMDGKTIVATVDCTGHGVPGAMMSMIGSNLLDRIVRIWENSSPADILTLLHKQIHLVLRQKYTKNNYGMDITVVSLEEMDKTYKLTFSGAKTSLYYHENNSTELKELKGTRKAIGGKQNEKKQFENQSITLEKGSTIYMLTDGLQDQQNNEQEKLGSHRLKDFLFQHINLSLTEQKDKLEKMIEERLEGVDQRDDMLVLVCKLS
jgi:serine phosphatase RsbU (regulator of sigma subunit)